MTAQPPALRILPYHQALADYLEQEEPETWHWFGSSDAQSTYAESLRVELLKHTYRLDEAAYPELFAALAEAKTKLGLEVPVTLYQSQSNRELNAALYFIPGEAHVVFEGNVLQLLSPAELRAVLGHELAHFVLWSSADRRVLLTDRIAQAMANDPRAEASHVESARLMRLYTEIYADRGSLLVTGDTTAVISGLVKMQTGLTQVDAASYVKQADEILARAKIKTDQLSHPEAFIRTRSIMLWSEGGAGVDEEVTRMIEGQPSLDRLDLTGQQRLTAQTRRWLQLYLRPELFHTDAVRGQARLFFPDFDFAPAEHTDLSLTQELSAVDLSVRDYFCYLLLDFVGVDPDLEQEPLRAAFVLANQFDWDDRLESLVVKELKIKKREVQQLHAEALAADESVAVTKPDDDELKDGTNE